MSHKIPSHVTVITDDLSSIDELPEIDQAIDFNEIIRQWLARCESNLPYQHLFTLVFIFEVFHYE